MSREVDERIARLEFDNKNFEKNAKQTSSTLDSLKKKMNFDNEAKSMDKAFDDKRFNIFCSGLEKVKVGFSALQMVAASAINNLTNRVINLGVNLTKQVSTINAMRVGFEKYGSLTQSEASFSAQGHDLKEVNKELEKLMWFTDETSYDFESMTKIMAQFTSMGKGLDESANAMMGISTWAASMGKNSGVAANVMTQLAQTLGSYVKLQDWQSVISAGMSGEVFKKAALEAAVLRKELTPLMDGSYISKNGKIVTINNFERNLTEAAWFTSDVLLDVLNKYAKGANQVYDIYQNLNGEMLTSDIMDEYSDKIDKFGLEMFKMAQKARTFSDAIGSARTAVETSWLSMYRTVFGQAEEATKLWTDLSEVLIEIFAGKYSSWKAILKEWRKLGGRDDLFGKTEEFQGALWNIFDAIQALKNIIKEAWNDIFPAKTIKESGEQLKSLTQRFREFTKRLILTGDNAERVKNIFKGLFGTFKTILDILKSAWVTIKPILKAILNAVQGIFKGVGDVLKDVFDGEDGSSFLDGLVKSLKGLVRKIIELFKAALPVIESVFNTITKFIGIVVDKLKSIINTGNNLISFKDLLTASFWAGLTGIIIWNLKNLISWSRALKDTVIAIGDAFDAIAVRKYTTGFKSIAIGIALIAGSLALVASIDKDKLGTALIVIGGVWAAMMSTINVLKTLHTVKGIYKDVAQLRKVLLAFAITIGVVALSIRALAKQDQGKVLTSVYAIISLLAGMLLMAKVMATNSAQILKGAKALALFSIALGLLAIPMIIVNFANGENSANILLFLAALFAMVMEVVAMAKVIEMANPKKILASLGIMALIAALLVALCIPMIQLSYINYSNLSNAIIAVGALILETFGIAYLIGNSDKIFKTKSKLSDILKGLGVIVLIIVTLAGLAIPLQMLSLVNSEKAIEAVIPIGMLIIELSVLSSWIGSFANVQTLKGFGILTLIILSLAGLAIPLFIISRINAEGAYKVVGAIAGVFLAVYGLAVLFGSNAALLLKGIGIMLLFSASSILIAYAFTDFVNMLLLLQTLDYKKVIEGLLAIAIALGSIIAFALLTSNAAVPMMTFAAFIAILSASISSLANSLTRVATAIDKVSSSLNGSNNKLKKFVTLVKQFLKEDAPALFREFFKTLFVVVSEFVKLIADLIIEAILTTLKALSRHIYEIVTIVISIIREVLRAINDEFPKLWPEIKRFLVDTWGRIVKDIWEFMPTLVQDLFDILIRLINSLGEVIRKNVVPFRNAIFNLLDNVVDSVLIFFGFKDENSKESSFFADLGEKAGNSFWTKFLGPLGWVIETISSAFKGLFEPTEEYNHPDGSSYNLDKGFEENVNSAIGEALTTLGTGGLFGPIGIWISRFFRRQNNKSSYSPDQPNIDVNSGSNSSSSSDNDSKLAYVINNNFTINEASDSEETARKVVQYIEEENSSYRKAYL